MKKPTDAEIEAISASWAWRLTRPLYRIEREVRRWRLKRLLAKLGLRPEAVAPPRRARSSSPASAAGKVARPVAQEAVANDFVLYRILGNDLAPRHRKGQTRTNLALILAHESDLENCRKRWIVNRIIDPAEEALILDLLERSGQAYTRIPFDLDEYASIGWASEGFAEPGFFLSKGFDALGDDARARAEVHARRLKNLYAMNNNGARNLALEEGRGQAKWILPWDGNCFLTEAGWSEIRRAVTEQAHLPYFVVPMLRVTRNDVLLQGGKEGEAEDEPQLIFRHDATERFDEGRPYGTRPKVDLLMRLGVPGRWDGWTPDPWEAPMAPLSGEAGRFAQVGWVGRLESGQPQLERSGQGTIRSIVRADAIVAALDELDTLALGRRLRPDALCVYDERKIAGLASAPEALRAALRLDAEAALGRGPHSVVDKPEPAPGGRLHDYLSLARYWWPDPASPDGLPYVGRDGQDVFESGLPAFAPDRFDRARVQHLFDDSIVLALAGSTHADARYLRHAAGLIRTWFVDPSTRMAPHLRFAQLVRGHDENERKGYGILDFAGLPRLLDAVRLLERDDALTPADRLAFRHWLRSYSDWLQDSPQGRHAARALNNHGTFLDLQVAAIATFLGDAGLLNSVLRRSRERLPHQFAPDGSQPLELTRARPRHYSAYNLVAWTSLARLAESVGDDLWNYRVDRARPLEAGLRWLLDRSARRDWPRRLPSEAGDLPIAPLRAAYSAHYGNLHDDDGSGMAQPPFSLDPMTGVPPYWALQR